MIKSKKKILMFMAIGVTMALSSAGAYASTTLVKCSGNISKAIAYDGGKYVFEGVGDDGQKGLYINDNGSSKLIEDADDYSMDSLNKYSQKYGDIIKDGVNYKVDLNDGTVEDRSVESIQADALENTRKNLAQRSYVPLRQEDAKRNRAFTKVGTGQFDDVLYLFGMKSYEPQIAVISFKLSDCKISILHHSPQSHSDIAYDYADMVMLGQNLGWVEDGRKEYTEEETIRILNGILDEKGFRPVTRGVDNNGNVILISEAKKVGDLYNLEEYKNNYNSILRHANVIDHGYDDVNSRGKDYVGITNGNGIYENTFDVCHSVPDTECDDTRVRYISNVISEDEENVYSMYDGCIKKVSKEREDNVQYGSVFSGITKLYGPKSVSEYSISDTEITNLINDSNYNSLSKCPCRVIDGKLYFTQVSNDGTKVKVSIISLIDEGAQAKLEGSYEQEIDSFNFDDKTNTVENKAYENSTVSIDNNGYTWILKNGKVYKFNGISFEEIYECDSNLDRMDIYDDDDIIVYSSKGDGYASLLGADQSKEEKNFTVDGINYIILHDNYISVTGAEQNHSDALNIPDVVEYNGKSYEVRSIGDFGFKNDIQLQSISLLSPINFIGYAAFQECTNLNSINIPDSVTCIADSAFSGCSSLNSIIISENIDTIGAGAFYNCASLSSIDIKGTVANIGQGAFEGCSADAIFTVYNNETKEALISSGIDEKNIVLSTDNNVSDEEMQPEESVVNVDDSDNSSKTVDTDVEESATEDTNVMEKTSSESLEEESAEKIEISDEKAEVSTAIEELK